MSLKMIILIRLTYNVIRIFYLLPLFNLPHLVPPLLLKRGEKELTYTLILN